MGADIDLDEKHVQLDEYISSLETKRGALIQVLHKAQEIYGYLSQDIQRHVAHRLELPVSRVHGVVSFYSFFHTEPKGKLEIHVCTGTACFVRGAEAVLQAFQKELGIEAGETTKDGMFTLDAIRCVGACGLAPVVTVNGRVYGRVKPEDVQGILEDQMTEEEFIGG